MKRIEHDACLCYIFTSTTAIKPTSLSFLFVIFLISVYRAVTLDIIAYREAVGITWSRSVLYDQPGSAHSRWYRWCWRDEDDWRSFRRSRIYRWGETFSLQVYVVKILIIRVWLFLVALMTQVMSHNSIEWVLRQYILNSIGSITLYEVTRDLLENFTTCYLTTCW